MLGAAPFQMVERGHYDLLMEFQPGGEHPGWHFHARRCLDFQLGACASEERIPLQDAIFAVPHRVQGQIPGGSAWEFLGSPGTPLYLLPESGSEAYQKDLVWLGLNTEDIPEGFFSGGLSGRGRVNLEFLGAEGSGPAQGGVFALFQFDRFGTPRSTEPAPLSSHPTWEGNNRVENIPVGAHAHYNWAMTAPGLYRLHFRISGTARPEHGGGERAGEFTVHIHVADGRSPWGAAYLDESGWKRSPWLGFYYDAFDPFVRHESFGWLYAIGESPEALWLFDFQSAGWFFTSRHHYPHLYHFSSQSWLVYGKGTANPRWFYRYGDGWFAESELSD